MCCAGQLTPAAAAGFTPPAAAGCAPAAWGMPMMQAPAFVPQMGAMIWPVKDCHQRAYPVGPLLARQAANQAGLALIGRSPKTHKGVGQLYEIRNAQRAATPESRGHRLSFGPPRHQKADTPSLDV